MISLLFLQLKPIVECDNIKKKSGVQCSVLQGFNLGPLLFLIHNNDLAFVSPKLFYSQMIQTSFVGGGDVT